jgi:hypothetical protein
MRIGDFNAATAGGVFTGATAEATGADAEAEAVAGALQHDLLPEWQPVSTKAAMVAVNGPKGPRKE